MDEYIVIVYHHGGLLVRNDDGVLVYINGRVDQLPEVDVDFVNLKDLETILKGYGYEKCARMMWLKLDKPDLEHGLQPLCLDSNIKAMCVAALANGNRIHIYFEGCISVPDIISPAHSHDSEEDHGMFSAEEESDSYESAKDEAYKPPSPGVEDLSEEDDKDACRPKKKKPTRQSNEDNNKENLVEEDNLGEEENLDRDKNFVQEENLVHKEDANNSFEENRYEDDYEKLKTPCSSDNKGHDSEVWPQFNEKPEFGHVYLELGMEIVSIQQFKNVVKDYNISLRRQFIWLKNDKARSRARCNVEDCEWLIYCAWNSKLNTFQIKTFYDNHTYCRVFQNKRATGYWVAKKLEKQILTQPNMTRTEVYEHMKVQYNTHLNMKKVSKALQKVKKSIEGSEKEQYGKLREYFSEN
ncbi:hypothetical protein QN277_000333 [Acacia crassicarpa]|uniref:Transposase MuDR plant domain-containing protein n=1 Tax=Acacia crassicarpa TaxID=499986 RepID=A0AAE1N6A0_9FABA|nr:hypothetical protein QN277_000333 [Acacia crassicarpa]